MHPLLRTTYTRFLPFNIPTRRHLRSRRYETPLNLTAFFVSERCVDATLYLTKLLAITGIDVEG